MGEELGLERRRQNFYASAIDELRIEAIATTPTLKGYAVPFNTLSKDLGGFRERILPTALDATLLSGADIRALVDHDHSKLLGRISAGTLRIRKDERGLLFDVDVPDTTYGRDIKVLVERGDVKGMSFGFRVPPGGDRVIRDNGVAIREIAAMQLIEITVTSIPAYGETTVDLRIDPGLTARMRPKWTLESAAAHLRRIASL